MCIKTISAYAPPKKPAPKRARVVEGSCWPCKKRRIKCDLSRPQCRRCEQDGHPCDYNARLIRWSRRPNVHVPAQYQALLPGLDANLSPSSLDPRDQRTLDYFQARVWPLLSTALQPCDSPLRIALESKVVMLATCVLAESHRRLQDGRARGNSLDVKRVECLSLLRTQVDECCTTSGAEASLQGLLFAVLLLYLHDGFLESSSSEPASTMSHHQGVLALIHQAGDLQDMLGKAPDSLRMLLSEFASTDLTAALLQGTVPAFPSPVWAVIDQGVVWWERDPLGRCSLATVFRDLSEMAFYYGAVCSGGQQLSMDQVRFFEQRLRPTYVPLSVHDLDGTGSSCSGEDSGPSGASPTSAFASPSTEAEESEEALHTFTLVRAFQHAGLIYLYRAVCGLPAPHAVVQQHVEACLDSILAIPRPSKALNCVIFPLCVAGAHALTPKARAAVLQLVDAVYEVMRFASVQAVRAALVQIWEREDQSPGGWVDMFASLGSHVLVL